MKKFQQKLASVKKVTLDTNCFIYQFAKHPKYSLLTNHLFSLLDQKKNQIITSVISLIEVNSHPNLKNQPELIKIYENFFLKTKNLFTYSVDEQIGIKAADIRKIQRFTTPDSIQIATAIIHKADIFITNDQKFKRNKLIPTLILKDYIS